MGIKDLMLEIINDLTRWTYAYEQGEPLVSDKVWDEKYYELQELERNSGIVLPNSPTQKIVYRSVTELKEVYHNHPMLSLDKTKDWDAFTDYFRKIAPLEEVIGMLKLDGLTCSLRYEDGKLISAETRGDGEKGEDIYHNALVIPSIPKNIPYKQELIIDGEIICTYDNFKKFEDKYKNPRNFASGSIRLLDSKECSRRNLTFIAWNVVKGLSDSLSDNFADLQKMGFMVTPYTITLDEEYLQEKAKEFGYPIDGLVGRFQSRKFGEGLGATGHHSRAAFAFKFYDEEYETRLVRIEYEPSRTGQLTPVAVFEPVDTGDSVIERASLHNISILRETLGLYPDKDQTIWVMKANDIIPQVSRANKNDIPHDHILEDGIAEYCPICGQKTTLRTNPETKVVTLWCENAACEGKLINKLEHMHGKGKIEIKGLSKATFEKLIDLEWIKSPRDVYEVLPTKQKEWKSLAGFGERSVENIIRAIEESKFCNLGQVICGAGIPLIGGTASNALAKQFATWSEFRNAIKEGFDFYSLENFGIEMHRAIVNFDYTEIDYIVENYLTIEKQKVQETSDSLNGITVCITGKLYTYKNRDEFKSAIENAGGKVVGSVSSKVKVLVNNDSESATAKNKAAKAAGIPILTEEEFKNTYLKS